MSDMSDTEREAWENAARLSAELRAQYAGASPSMLAPVAIGAPERIGGRVLSPDEASRCVVCEQTFVRQSGQTCEACMRRRAHDERVQDARDAWKRYVPESLRWASLSSPKLARWCQDNEAVERARKAVELREHVPLVTLLGEAGAGKTTLACAMLGEFVRFGTAADASAEDKRHARSFCFAVAIDLIEEARRRRSREDGVTGPLLRAQRASVLVLDEFTGFESEKDREVLTRLIHERHRERKHTIITTPHDRARIASDFDGGIARRVFDDAYQIDVRKLGAASLRLAEPAA